jgi:hypothetical protein
MHLYIRILDESQAKTPHPLQLRWAKSIKTYTAICASRKSARCASPNNARSRNHDAVNHRAAKPAALRLIGQLRWTLNISSRGVII